MEYILLVASLVGIVFGADFLVNGAVVIAKKYKVSDFVIGAAIVGIGTSMPEFVVSFIGALNGNADVAIGNVIGSNIFNVLGITISDYFVMIIAAILPFVIGLKGKIGRMSGIIMIICFMMYNWYLISNQAV